jgi:hypothetical protein
MTRVALSGRISPEPRFRLNINATLTIAALVKVPQPRFLAANSQLITFSMTAFT